MAELPKSDKATADHLTDFDPIPLYNVWKFKIKSSGSNHFGNVEPIILDRLLYLYTNPFDNVILYLKNESMLFDNLEST